jgi:hypothetical protein
MNSGFDPVVVAPGLFKTQTATQQKPFHFGGSQVPIHLGMRGSGMAIRPVKPPAGLVNYLRKSAAKNIAEAKADFNRK